MNPLRPAGSLSLTAQRHTSLKASPTSACMGMPHRRPINKSWQQRPRDNCVEQQTCTCAHIQSNSHQGLLPALHGALRWQTRAVCEPGAATVIDGSAAAPWCDTDRPARMHALGATVQAPQASHSPLPHPWPSNLLLAAPTHGTPIAATHARSDSKRHERPQPSRRPSWLSSHGLLG